MEEIGKVTNKTYKSDIDVVCCVYTVRSEFFLKKHEELTVEEIGVKSYQPK